MDLRPEQEQLLRQVAEASRRRAEEEKKNDRTRMMGDVILAQRRRGFRGDDKVRWRMADAALMLMRGLAYAIGPSAQWLPEYDGVAEWLSDNRGRGLMCIGDCGRGKTVITRDILPILFEKVINVRFSDGFVGHICYSYFRATELRSRWSEIEHCKVICVDDVGTEPVARVYGETHNYFAELVDLCNDRDKLLICSTNLTHAQLFGGEEDGVTYPARYDQRTFSRLTANTVRVYFEGEDLRIKNNQ